MHKLLFYNKFIIFPYMFRALMCSSSGGQNCIIQHLISSHPVGGHLVHRLREDSQPQMLYNTTLTSWWWAQQCLKHVQEYIESPLSTRAPDGHLQVWWYQMLHNAIFTPPMMSTTVLETCRGTYETYYKTRICASSRSIAKIILRCTVSKTTKFIT